MDLTYDKTKFLYSPLYTPTEIIKLACIERKALLSWVINPDEKRLYTTNDIGFIMDQIKDLPITELPGYAKNIQTYKPLRPEDVGYLWLEANTEIATDSMDTVMFMVYQKDLVKLSEGAFFRADEIMSGYTKWRKSVGSTVKKMKDDMTEKSRNVKRIESLPPVTLYNITDDYITFTHTYTYPYEDIIYLFNDIKTSVVFPYAYVNSEKSWSKLHVFSEFQSEWLEERKNMPSGHAIMLMHATGIPVFITPTSIQYDVSENETDFSEVIVAGLKELFPTISITGVDRIVVKKTFELDIEHHREVFMDMVMTNDVFRQFIDVDESVKVAGKRKKFSMFFLVDKPDMRLNLSMSYSEYNNSRLIVKISKGKSEWAVNHFMNVFALLMAEYVESIDDIVDIYKSVIPKFKTDRDTKYKREKVRGVLSKKLAERHPELFVRGWVRQCLNMRQPRIVEAEDLADYAEDDAIRFPKDGTGDYYTCTNNEVYKYIGLQKNTLSNNDVYKYFPCCFQDKKAATGSGSNYEAYMNDGGKETQSVLLTSNKLIAANTVAVVPDDIETFIQGLMGRDITLRRIGVGEAYSLTKCLMYGSKFSIVSDEEARDKQEQLKKYYTVCRQEMYDFSQSEFEAYTRLSTISYDHLVRALEKVFKCRIIAFDVDRKKKKVDFFQPRSYGVHYPPLYGPLPIVFLIRQKIGKNSYQYELIVDQTNMNESRFPLLVSSAVAEFMDDRRITVVNEAGETGKFKNDLDEADFSAQTIDFQGKCTGVYSKDYKVYMTINPSAPYDLPIYKNQKIQDDTTEFVRAIRPGEKVLYYNFSTPAKTKNIIDVVYENRRHALYLQQMALKRSASKNKVLTDRDFVIRREKYTGDVSLTLVDKLVVPDEKTMDGLIMYIKSFRKNKRDEYNKFKTRGMMVQPFTFKADFRDIIGTKIFPNDIEMMREINVLRANTVHTAIDTETTVPYVYQWDPETVVMLQNAGSDIRVAFNYIRVWNASKVNIAPIDDETGYDPDSYKLYSAGKHGVLEEYTVLSYADGDDTKYISVLQFK